MSEAVVRYVCNVYVHVEGDKVTRVVLAADELTLAPEHEDGDDEVRVAESVDWPAWENEHN